MIREHAQGDYSSVNIKKQVWVHKWDWEEGEHYRPISRDGILVGVDKGTVRIRYPDYSYSKVQYLKEASLELKSLAALWICDLVPTGVFADRIEEEFPVHKGAADILREWERVKNKGITTNA